MPSTTSERVYEKMPVPLQNVACSLKGFQLRRQRYNRTFRDTLRFLSESDRWDSDTQQRYEQHQLRRIVTHAAETVPYYRDLFSQLKLRPQSIRSTGDLRQLPILSKEAVRELGDRLLSEAIPLNDRRTCYTGGTTGKSLRIVTDVGTQPWQWAIWWRHRRRFGVDPSSSSINFAGRSVVPLRSMEPPVWRHNLASKQTYLSVHHLTEQNLPRVAEYLCGRSVDFYSGYPSALYLLARYFIDEGISLPRPPRVVSTGAETVLPHHRAAIESAFSSIVADQYGATEQCANFSECELHTYHHDYEFGVVEYVPAPSSSSDTRRLVCTGFRNLAMPLIRYDIGDLVTMSYEQCVCGRPSRSVDRIDGRIESYVRTPDGRQLSRLDFIFKKNAHIEEAQFVQNAVDSVDVLLVLRSRVEAFDEASLVAELRRYLGEVIEISVRRVDKIERSANGKFRQIVSRLDPDFVGGDS